MSDWNVTVTYRGTLDRETTRAIAEALVNRDGIAANTPDGRFSVAITSHFGGDKAAGDALDTINKTLMASGVGSVEPIAVEAMEYDEYERRVREPDYPELMSAGEVAEALGVSRQRVHQLAVDHSDFPAPLYELSAGKLWTAEAIRGFRHHWTRKPGRKPARIA